jgi:hypothetical protein
MPDHVHLLVEGQSESSDARALIARMKQNSGFYFKRRSANLCGSGMDLSGCCVTMKEQRRSFAT